MSIQKPKACDVTHPLKTSTCDVTRESYLAYKLVPMNEVLARISISKTQLYRLINVGEFPRSVSVGLGGRVAFVESEVNAWIASRIAMRETDAGAEARRQRAIRAVGGRQQ